MCNLQLLPCPSSSAEYPKNCSAASLTEMMVPCVSAITKPRDCTTGAEAIENVEYDGDSGGSCSSFAALPYELRGPSVFPKKF
jgi:hypothetical protein